MRAITVIPGRANSARLEQVPLPPLSDGALLVRALALGVCGTDREILAGIFGDAPPGAGSLVLGHESLGVVEEAPKNSGFAPGDRVVGIVRRPDPVPCPSCAAGEWDMCRNGLYTEHGIKALHGFGSQWFRLDPAYAVKVDPKLGLAGVLVEPVSVVAKAWRHVDAIGSRSPTWQPARLLVTGAGPIGLLAALLGAQRGCRIDVYDHQDNALKADLVSALGGTYHSSTGTLGGSQFDVVMECTAAAPAIVEALSRSAPNGIVCFVGVSAPGRKSEFDIGGFNRKIVLNNEVVFGSVNANRLHYEDAVLALSRADRVWLDRLITRKVPLERFHEALELHAGDVKVVIAFDNAG